MVSTLLVFYPYKKCSVNARGHWGEKVAHSPTAACCPIRTDNLWPCDHLVPTPVHLRTTLITLRDPPLWYSKGTSDKLLNKDRIPNAYHIVLHTHTHANKQVHQHFAGSEVGDDLGPHLSSPHSILLRVDLRFPIYQSDMHSTTELHSQPWVAVFEFPWIRYGQGTYFLISDDLIYSPH